MFSVGDVITVILLALAVGLAVFFIRRGKKSGGCGSCGGSCAGCSGCGTVQNAPEKKEQPDPYAIPGEQSTASPQSGGFVKPYGDIAPPENPGER